MADSERDEIRRELAEVRQRIERTEALLVALLQHKEDRLLSRFVSDEERARRDRITAQFANLQTEVEGRYQP